MCGELLSPPAEFGVLESISGAISGSPALA